MEKGEENLCRAIDLKGFVVVINDRKERVESFHQNSFCPNSGNWKVSMRGVKMTFDEWFVKVFFRWGLISHRIRAFLFIGPFILTGFLMIGFVWIKEQVSQVAEITFV